jgi:hypothetical protein
VSSSFLGSWTLWLCFCVLGFVFLIDPFWKNMFLRLRGGAHMFQSCLHVVQNGLLPTIREIHLSFENLVIINALNLHASLMDIHHDTSLRYIFEDDSISLAFRARIHSHLSKWVRLWLVVRPSIYSFHITHSIFTSMLGFCLGLIQPSSSSFFTCECGHRLDAFGTHLTYCPFGGQHIATHDAIRDVMYALV